MLGFFFRGKFYLVMLRCVEYRKNLTNENRLYSVIYVVFLKGELGGVVYGKDTPLLHKR